MTEVYLLLGSNEGKPDENMRKAKHAIALQCGSITKQSSMYETEAWGITEQNSFLNQAIAIETDMAPNDLLTALKAIETETGRKPTTKWGPRVIDIDILFYGNEIVNLANLIIPHPYIQDRKFTLAPLNEIAPQLIHPILHKSIRQLLAECSDTSQVNLIAQRS